MSLKLDFSVKKCLKWGGIALVTVLFLGFFIRLVTWEDAYYREKEGSERDIVERQIETEYDELDETEPTEQVVREWIVAADRPRYLTVKRLGVYNARILPMGVNANGALATPYNIFDAGWYTSSGKPGQGGTVLIDGHNGGPTMYGIFKYLPSLEYGDIITVERGDGAIFNYAVVENIQVSIDDSDSYMNTAMRSPEAGRESLTIVSCSGEWSQSRYTYLSRQFVRAVLVE